MGSNPTHSASKRAHPTGWALLLFFVVGGIRKAALSGMPVACRNRRGFSAEKESHPHYQITGFSRSSGRGISYYGWGSKFILRSSKSHPLRQRAPLCTHSSFPETFVTVLTPRSGKRPYYQITAVLHMPCGRFSHSYKVEKPRRLVQPSRFSQVFLMNCSPHLGQRILMRPFPRGTRTTCRQRGQVKYRFCRSRSLVKKRWKAAFSRRRASMLRE